MADVGVLEDVCAKTIVVVLEFYVTHAEIHCS